MNIQPGQYKIHENESELDANSILTELDKGELNFRTGLSPVFLNGPRLRPDSMSTLPLCYYRKIKNHHRTMKVPRSVSFQEDLHLN